jgi:hypothetical protein
MRQARLLGICLLLILLGSCHSSKVLFAPHPSSVQSIEGYASLRIKGDQGSYRSKFSFLFQLPDQGKIVVFDPLGRTVYQIVVIHGQSYLVVPSKRAYWEGDEEDIIDNFLGFRLNLKEMIFLLSGSKEEMSGQDKLDLEDWFFIKDEGGRIKEAMKRNLRIMMEEFFENTPYARILIFDHPVNTGRLKILRMAFNQPYDSGVFSTEFLGRFERKSWEEIQEMMKNAN